MAEGINPYNPNSEKPSDFMGNWVDENIATTEESEANKVNAKKTAWQNLRQGVVQEDGTYTPKIKETSDIDWLMKHGIDYQEGYMGIGITGKYDAANTPFEDLPFDFK